MRIAVCPVHKAIELPDDMPLWRWLIVHRQCLPDLGITEDMSPGQAQIRARRLATIIERAAHRAQPSTQRVYDAWEQQRHLGVGL